ncbi:MAG: type II toxin-antitoxin system RelE/ParE family toxin [Gemmataceae bacterium]|nr:type II toxin-antitoxin system RelE/ParE family toxin [Gemmataceae bacterium]
MELFISDKKLLRAIEDGSLSGRYGAAMAKKILLRLNALRAAESLADFWPPKSGPERCHELIGKLAGLFSVDVKQPYRLLFKPIEEAPPKDRSDEKKRWESITSIDILAIENTHE